MLDVLNVLMDIFPTNGMLDRLRYFLIVIGIEVIDGDSIERFLFNEVFMVLSDHSLLIRSYDDHPSEFRGDKG